MLTDLLEIISDPELGGTNFTYERLVETVNNKGRATSVGVPYEAQGNIQPAPGKERELLPVADRNKSVLLVFTPANLSAGDGVGTKADRVFYMGNAYRVSLAEPWREHGGFTKALIVLEGREDREGKV